MVGYLDEGESRVRLAAVDVLVAQGKRREAANAAQAAKDRLLDRAGRIREPSWRAAFLAVRENARTLELASALEEALAR